MVGLACMIDQRWLGRLARPQHLRALLRLFCGRRGPAPRGRAGDVRLVLNIVRRPYGKAADIPFDEACWHDKSVVGFRAIVQAIMLYMLQQDVILRLIYSMERRIHPVSPCTRTRASRLNPEDRRELRSKTPSDLLTHGQCRQPAPQANSPMSRLGWPRTSDGDPIYLQHRRVAASPPSVPVAGQKVADRQ